MQAPLFDVLSKEDCERLLERVHVGRLAFALHDAVDVVPLGYRFEDGWIYGRTSPGGKLETLGRNRRVAFEVDEASGPFEWKSVVVHGSFYLLDPASSTEDKQKVERIFPGAVSDSDPVSFRNQFFGISIEEMSGRSATPDAGKPRPVVHGRSLGSAADRDDDVRLRTAVVAEISKAAGDQEDDIRTAVENGVVILTGSISSARIRSTLDAVIARVPGVRGIVQELDVVWPVKIQRTPTEIVLEALAAAKKEMPDDSGNFVVIFENGWLRLEGTVRVSARQRLISSLQHISGSRGVIDMLTELPD